MAYVSRLQHDVFISYAVVDNEGPYHKRRGWVQAFEEQLKAEVQREVNDKRPVDVWLDRKRLSCGDPFDDEIRDALESAAVLVVLLSKQYLASEYCQLEREAFLRAIAKQQDVEKRIFIVELTDPRKLPEQVPDELARIHRVPMWEVLGSVPKRLGHPVPNQEKLEHQSFYDRAFEVAYAIAERLDEMAAVQRPDPVEATNGTVSKTDVASGPVEQRPVSSGPSIYLSQPPRGTDEQRFAGELQSRLENAIPSVGVLPNGPIPKTPDEAAHFVGQQLDESQLYVHLVGYNPGSTPSGFPLPLPRFQKNIADQRQHPTLIWRLPNVAPADIDDADQRALAEQARAGGVEDCRRAIVDLLEEFARPQASATSAKGDTALGETLFVNHLPDDEQLAREVCRAVAEHESTRHAYVCVKRSFDGATEEELRLDFERSLCSCDSLLMIYGAASKPAAKAQMLECVKVVGRRQPTGRSIGAWFVVVGPPSKPDVSLDLFFDGLHEIDCRQQLQTPLVEALAEHRKGGQ